MILGYILDWFSDPSLTTLEPLFIFDVGAGFGKLGFLIMYRLFEMKELWPQFDHPPFMWVMET